MQIDQDEPTLAESMMYRTILCILSLTLASSCGSKDEWCSKLVIDSCACEANEESDLCQDAEIVANNGEEDACEEYYSRSLPEECQTTGSDWVEGETCAVTAETCEAFAEHYLTCEGADEAYAASLADYDDAGCAATYTAWVAAGCCGDS